MTLPGGQARLLGMLHQRQPERLEVGQRPAGHRRAGDGRAVVADGHRTRVGQGPVVGQLSPSRPRVAAATTRTRAAAPDAAATTPRSRHGSSSGGSVFGMAHTVVNPPWAAARVPVVDRLGPLVAGGPEVGVEVTEARRRDEPHGVDARHLERRQLVLEHAIDDR